jgi:hypothetical protein
MLETAKRPGGHSDCVGCTMREDTWWGGPLLTFLGLSLFVCYSTWAAFQGEHYFHENYLSPFYSPVLFTDTAVAGAAPVEHSWFGVKPSQWPSFLPFSPAFLILIFPGAFRFTCYYYRKAYYRSFALTPPGCAVGGIRRGQYNGETKLLLIQNLHRYALYFALIFIGILYYDAFLAFNRGGALGVGVGSLVLLTNATLLACYTCGCHSFRHLIGGRLNRFSGSEVSHLAYQASSVLNRRHMLFAWMSLFWVGFSDLYVRLVSMDLITDLNTWG